MDPTAIIGGAIGIGKGIAGLVQRIKARRARKNAPPPKLALPKQEGTAQAAGGGLAYTGQNPVAQSGVESLGPTIAQPQAQAAGQLKSQGAPSSLDRAKQDYLFQVAMNGDRLR